MTIAQVALPVAVAQTFDYWVPSGLAVERGSIVRVRLAKRRLIGVVTRVDARIENRAPRSIPIEERVALPALPADVIAQAEFVAEYYQTPLGAALALAVPPLGERAWRPRQCPPLELTPEGTRDLPARVARAPAAKHLYERLVALHRFEAEHWSTLSPHARRILRGWQDERLVAPADETPMSAARLLNDAQRSAADAIIGELGSFTTFLLQGVTGSGKTDVYLEAARAALAAGGQVLVLVPEINLTPQFEARVRGQLAGVPMVTLHSGLADGERRAHWLAASRGQAKLVLGTRLAVFAPLPALALIVVDEEHDGSFKQQDGVRYHARDVAVWRARERGVPIVLGSATPSLESFVHAEAGRYRLLTLPRRADPRAAFPRLRLVADRTARARNALSEELVAALGECLGRHEQALVFVNRRGFAPSLLCAACRWEAQCPRCTSRLTLHRDPTRLRCHHCGHAVAVPRACPICGNVDLLPIGMGTQRLERILRETFPTARIARIDRDTTRTRDAFSIVRRRVEEHALDILIGTQMLAKGHDFTRLTLVGVLGSDNALYSADFRATERLAALLTQVSGRAGRADLPGEVIVQTDFPEHPVYAMLASHDYARFARVLVAERREAKLPPITHAALLLAEAHARADADAFLGHAQALAHATLKDSGDAVEVFAPVPALLARRAGLERGQLVVQSERRADLQRFLPRWREALAAGKGARVRHAIDVDPGSFS